MPLNAFNTFKSKNLLSTISSLQLFFSSPQIPYFNKEVFIINIYQKFFKISKIIFLKLFKKYNQKTFLLHFNDILYKIFLERLILLTYIYINQQTSFVPSIIFGLQDHYSEFNLVQNFPEFINIFKIFQNVLSNNKISLQQNVEKKK